MASTPIYPLKEISEMSLKERVEEMIKNGSFLSEFFIYDEYGFRDIKCMFLGKHEHNIIGMWFNSEHTLFIRIGSNSDFEPIIRVRFEDIYNFISGNSLPDGTYLYGKGIERFFNTINNLYYIRIGLSPIYEIPVKDLLPGCKIPDGLTYPELVKFALEKFDELLSDPDLPMWKKFKLWEDQNTVRHAAETLYYEENPNDISYCYKMIHFVTRQHRIKK
jgi:hypothetical protein